MKPVLTRSDIDMFVMSNDFIDPTYMQKWIDYSNDHLGKFLKNKRQVSRFRENIKYLLVFAKDSEVTVRYKNVGASGIDIVYFELMKSTRVMHEFTFHSFLVKGASYRVTVDDIMNNKVKVLKLV